MKNILTTKELEKHVHTLYGRIKRLAQSDGVYRELNDYFDVGTPRGIDGSFCYSDEKGYHYGVNERGQLITNFTTQSLVEIVYAVISSEILWMAHDYERQHRIMGEDSRRQLFQKMMKYWNTIGGDYAERAKQDINETLIKAPFID